jgi:Sec-independent protein translocase protein TatA
MLIALLIALGVDLAVVLAVAVLVFGRRRRRWLRRQPGEFAGAIRVSGGVVEGLSPKWKHGSGRRVRDVLV